MFQYIAEEEKNRQVARKNLPHNWVMEDLLVEYRGDGKGSDVRMFVGHRKSVELGEFNLGFDSDDPVGDVLKFLADEGKLHRGSLAAWNDERWVTMSDYPEVTYGEDKDEYGD